jgi:coenzyme F420-reducing hydrogenase delta subunit
LDKKATKTTVSISDIAKFVQVELYLSAYRCSAVEFYSSKLESIYSIRKSCIGKEEYTFILNALSAKMDTDLCATMNIDDTSWKENYVKNKDLEKVVNNFRTACSRIAYNPTKIGKVNEKNILAALPKFFKEIRRTRKGRT